MLQDGMSSNKTGRGRVHRHRRQVTGGRYRYSRVVTVTTSRESLHVRRQSGVAVADLKVTRQVISHVQVLVSYATGDVKRFSVIKELDSLRWHFFDLVVQFCYPLRDGVRALVMELPKTRFDDGPELFFGLGCGDF